MRIRGLRPNLDQKKALKNQGHDPNEFLFKSKTATNLKFIHRVTGKILDLFI